MALLDQTRPPLRHFAAHEAVTAAAALQETGVVVLDGLFADGRSQALVEELRPVLRSQEPGGGVFYGKRAKRLNGLWRFGDAVAGMVADPTLMAVIDPVLLPHCVNYRLGLTAALEVWSGGEPQPLHRDEDIYAPFLKADHEVLVSVMIAGTDFTAANGATRIVPGSHSWPRDRRATPEEITQIEMSAGSVALWLGSVLHGMGVNTTDSPRLGAPLGYALGWLRQEEEQFLIVPAEEAARLPEPVRRVLGYQTHGPLLGWAHGNVFDEGGVADWSSSRLLA